MSCNDPGPTAVERSIELPAPPDAVWDALPALLGDDVELEPAAGGVLRARGTGGDRVGVVLEALPGERLAFRWAPVEGDGAPSEVEIGLERAPLGTGTIVRVRESRLDGDALVRSALLAAARA